MRNYCKWGVVAILTSIASLAVAEPSVSVITFSQASGQFPKDICNDSCHFTADSTAAKLVADDQSITLQNQRYILHRAVSEPMHAVYEGQFLVTTKNNHQYHMILTGFSDYNKTSKDNKSGVVSEMGIAILYDEKDTQLLHPKGTAKYTFKRTM
jgi:hypothetical protein